MASEGGRRQEGHVKPVSIGPCGTPFFTKTLPLTPEKVYLGRFFAFLAMK